MPSALAAGGDLWFAQDGEGADVLILPGLGDGVQAWAAPAGALAAAGRRVTSYDPRGFGRSARAADPAGLPRLVADAVAVLDAAGVERTDVVGASVGGLVGLQLALAAPERVRRLVLAGGWARADRRLRALLSTWTWAAARAQSADELLGAVYAVTAGPDLWEAGTVDDWITDAERTVGWTRHQAAFTATARAALEHDVIAVAGELHAPVLLVAGALDAVAPERYSRELRTLLPDARLEVAAGAGHQVLHERPHLLPETVVPWLEEQRVAA